MRKACKIVFEKPESKRPLGRPTYRQEDNIKIYFKYIGCADVD
jgi:hypothetical protein